MESERQELFTERFQAKGRGYFFDVKMSAKGATYLTISESRKRADGKYDHFRVMVFDDHIPNFRDAFGKAVKFIETRPGKQT